MCYGRKFVLCLPRWVIICLSSGSVIRDIGVSYCSNYKVMNYVDEQEAEEELKWRSIDGNGMSCEEVRYCSEMRKVSLWTKRKENIW